MENKLLVSVITAFYNGNIYLKRLFENISKNAENVNEASVELILVNDSPDVDILYEKSWVNGFDLRIIKNEENVGILKSRINGLDNARGKYVIFLDQDDILSDMAIKSQLRKIGKNDIIVSNGKDECKKNQYIYNTEKEQMTVMNRASYYLLGNRIVSPGQCLIKKTSIPELWKQCSIINNGSDDLLLWLFMLNENCRWSINRSVLYIHKNTGNNASFNSEVMERSSKEVLSCLKKYNIISASEEKLFIKRLKMRKFYEGKAAWRKIVAYALNPATLIKMVEIKKK